MRHEFRQVSSSRRIANIARDDVGPWRVRHRKFQRSKSSGNVEGLEGIESAMAEIVVLAGKGAYAEQPGSVEARMEMRDVVSSSRMAA